MDQSVAPPSPDQKSDVQRNAGATTYPYSPWLRLLQVAWLATLLLGVCLSAAGVPFRFEHLRTVPAEQVVFDQLLSEDAYALQELGISPLVYALWITALEIVFAGTFLAVSIFIFWRRSDEPIAVFVSLTLVAYGLNQPGIDDALVLAHPQWHWAVDGLQALATVCLLLVFYLLPDGRWVPAWTRILAVLWTLQIAIYYFFPNTPTNMIREGSTELTAFSTVIVALGWFCTGIYAQVYRYRHVSTPLQRQQTKWIVLSYLIVTLSSTLYFLSRALLPLKEPGFWRLLQLLVLVPMGAIFMMLVPIAYAAAILRYRLWDIDLIIRRTLIYGVLTGLLTLVYTGSVTLFQGPLRLLLGSRSDLAIVLATLLIALLFQPLRQQVQSGIDRRFYRAKIDAQRAFTDFAHELRLILELPALLQMLVARSTGLLHSAHGAVFMQDGAGRFVQAAAINPQSDWAETLPLNPATLAQLHAGQASVKPQEQPFPLLLPLTTPRVSGIDLVGVLALGPRLSEQPYRRDDLALLLNLAEQAGTALAVAQSIQLERQLAAQRNSPMGRAATLAHLLHAQPTTALPQLHELAQAAGQDPSAAHLLANLPPALAQTAPSADDATAEAAGHALGRLASGYHDLVRSQVTPELLAIGLRTLIAQLEQSPANTWSESAVALSVYRHCLAALTVDTLPQLEALAARWAAEPSATAPPFDRLTQALAGLRPVVDAVRAHERVVALEDKLTYLVTAIERLGQLPPQPGLLERVLLQGITARWVALFTTSLRRLRVAAQLEITLVTRQAIAAEQVTLVFTLTNTGRGPATDIRAELLPDDRFTLISAPPAGAALLPAQAMQLAFAVRPAAPGLRPSLRIHYADQEEKGKHLFFTAPVQLLPVPATFTPVPNPYSPGIPLRRNSPVFFGREDLLAAIRAAVQPSARSRVLVLTGERRMGKTSLAQQLPRYLQGECVTVYLDCQSLAIDPGLESFFYDVASEIAAAVGLPTPVVTDFAARPVAGFTREFLPRALAAVGERPLLLLFDEYEELELRVTNGKLPGELFSLLRHLMQHEAQLGFLFIGTQRLADLNPAYWSAFFNVALHRHVGRLSAAATKTVITQPVASYLFYEDLALDKLWRLTAGHPYFLQLLCHTLVGEANRAQRNYVLAEHLDRAVAQGLELGEAHFIFLWEGLRPPEQQLLHLLATRPSYELPLTPPALAQHTALTEAAVVEALAALVAREILRPAGSPTPGYEFVGDVLRHWILQRVR